MTHIETFDSREQRDARAASLRNRENPRPLDKRTDQVLSGAKDAKGRALGKIVWELCWYDE